MTKPLTRRDLLWGYGAQALNIGAGLILLPVILHFLLPEDVGLWFVFITLASLAQLLEFGFQPTLARNAAYVYAGARTLVKSGLPVELGTRGEIDRELLAALIAASRSIYRTVAVVASFVLFLLGSFYILTLLTPNQDRTTILIAWIAFSSGYIANFYYGYINGMLQGRGDLAAANKIVVITRGMLVLLGAGALAAGYGLMGLGLASMLSTILGRWVAIRYFYSSDRPEMAVIRKNLSKVDKKIIRTLWYNASRLGAVQVGAFLIQRGNVLVASSFLGLATAASYGMTVTVLMALSSVAMVVCQLQIPHISGLQVRGEREHLKTVYARILSISLAVFVLGFLCIFTVGDYLLEIVGSKTFLLPTQAFLLFGAILLLELNHTIAATYLTTVNKIPFVSAALISGVCTFVLALVLIKPFGVIGLIAAQGGVQLLYNNWKWPLEALKDLRLGFFDLMLLIRPR